MQAGMQTWWSKLDKFGPETRRAWVRVFTYWQLMTLALVIVFMVPVFWMTLQRNSVGRQESQKYIEAQRLAEQQYEQHQNDPYYVYTIPSPETLRPSSFPGLSKGLIIVTLAALFLRAGQLGYLYVKRTRRMKERLKEPTVPAGEQRSRIDAQAAWFISRGFDPIVTVAWDSKPNAVFGRPSVFNNRQAMLNQQPITLSSGLLASGLSDAELRAVLAEGVARGSMPLKLNGDLAAFLFSFMSIYVALRSLPYTLFTPVRFDALFVFIYALVLMGVQYLFIKWSTLVGNYLCLLADSMAVSVTGEPQALASAVTRVQAAGAEGDVPEMFADMMFVARESGRKLAPVPWNLPVPAQAAHLLRGSGNLTEARLHNLAAMARDQWPAFGMYHPNVASLERSTARQRYWSRGPVPPPPASKVAMGEKGMFACSKCGAENGADATYCALCLTPFAKGIVPMGPAASAR